MKKNTKKTATVVGMFGLLGLVLGMGGSTFAKYYSEASTPAAQATVAKFGLVVSANADNLWGDSYGKTASEASATVASEGTVVVAGSSSVVAPGTSGSLTLTVTGISEVKAKLSISLSDVTEIHLGTDYYPMKWSCGSQSDVKLSEISIADINITPSSTSFTQTITLSWDWDFYTNAATDTKDTKLAAIAKGDVAATANDSTTVSFKMTASLTQVQA